MCRRRRLRHTWTHPRCPLPTDLPWCKSSILHTKASSSGALTAPNCTCWYTTADWLGHASPSGRQLRCVLLAAALFPTLGQMSRPSMNPHTCRRPTSSGSFWLCHRDESSSVCIDCGGILPYLLYTRSYKCNLVVTTIREAIGPIGCDDEGDN